MKKIRYNDKLWFGKYKGTRISELIRSDTSYLHKLVNEHKFVMDDKINDYFRKNGIRMKYTAVDAAEFENVWSRPNDTRYPTQTLNNIHVSNVSTLGIDVNTEIDNNILDSIISLAAERQRNDEEI